jgi:hypothetical protein
MLERIKRFAERGKFSVEDFKREFGLQLDQIGPQHQGDKNRNYVASHAASPLVPACPELDHPESSPLYRKPDAIGLRAMPGGYTVVGLVFQPRYGISDDLVDEVFERDWELIDRSQRFVVRYYMQQQLTRYVTVQAFLGQKCPILQMRMVPGLFNQSIR